MPSVPGVPDVPTPGGAFPERRLRIDVAPSTRSPGVFRFDLRRLFGGVPGVGPLSPDPRYLDTRDPVPDLGPYRPTPGAESGRFPDDLPEERPVERRTPDEGPGAFPSTPSRSDRVPAESVPSEKLPGKPGGGPELGQPEARTSARLDLGVKAPDECLVDDQVVFAITLRNPSDEALEKVRVEVSFDEALVFPGSTETRVGREFDRIGARDSLEFSLTLVASKAGRRCARFTVFEGSAETASKTVCIEARPRRLPVSIVGPAERYAGNRAEFNVRVANTSESPQRSVRLAVACEPTLKPLEWSSDAEQSDGRLTWQLGDLAPGEGVEVQVEFECLRASEETCVTAFVSVDGDVPERRQFCLRIAPAEGPLGVEVSDETDPLPVGKQTAFVVRVKNRGLQAADDVAVAAEAPPLVDVLSARAEIDGNAAETDPAVDGRTVAFRAESLPVDAELVLRIRVQGATAGDDRLRVTVTSAGNDDLRTAEPITVNPPRPE